MHIVILNKHILKSNCLDGHEVSHRGLVYFDLKLSGFIIKLSEIIIKF